MQRDLSTFKHREAGHEIPTLAQLEGRQARLERELAAAFSTQPWPGALVDRLASALAVVEGEMAAARAAG